MKKVFISSTYIDLIKYREKASEAIERLGQHGIRMEVFGSRPEEPVNACLKEIEECDLFLGIYAHRYGCIPKGCYVSITEQEFNHALKYNKPVFCYLLNDEYPWIPKYIDEEPNKSKLVKFKNSISSGVVRDTFTNPDDLAYKIASSFGRYLSIEKKDNDNRYIKIFHKSSDLVELLEVSLLKFEEITKTDYNQIFLITTSPYARHLISVADSIPLNKQRYRIAAFDGLIGNACSTGKIINAKNVRERPGYLQAVLKTQSELVVPILFDGVCYGVVNSESEEINHFNDDIINNSKLFANALGYLLPLYNWNPSIKEKEAPWIKRTPKFT